MIFLFKYLECTWVALLLCLWAEFIGIVGIYLLSSSSFHQWLAVYSPAKVHYIYIYKNSISATGIFIDKEMWVSGWPKANSFGFTGRKWHRILLNIVNDKAHKYFKEWLVCISAYILVACFHVQGSHRECITNHALSSVQIILCTSFYIPVHYHNCTLTVLIYVHSLLPSVLWYFE